MDINYFTKKLNALCYPEAIPKPCLKKNATSAEAREFADALDKYEVDKPIFLALVKEHSKNSARIDSEFREALFEDLGISNNPKKDLLYSKAYELGHSSGYSEIYSYAYDLVDLIK